MNRRQLLWLACFTSACGDFVGIDAGPMAVSRSMQTGLLFSQDFDGRMPGLYSASDVAEDFTQGETTLLWNVGLDEDRVRVIDSGDGGAALRFLIPPGAHGVVDTGASWMVDIPDRERMRLSFRVRFSEAFPGTKGGKLLGLVGGESRPEVPGQGVTGGVGADGQNGWSGRVNWWRTGEPTRLVSYVYHPDSLRAPFGDEHFWFDDLRSAFPVRLALADTVNRWMDVTMEFGMNTPGSRDGFIRVHVDGRLSSYETFRFRDTDEFAIESLYVNVFAGGADSSFHFAEDGYVDIDDIRIVEVPAMDCSADSECDDGLFCNGTELCGLDGNCVPGPSVDLDDGDPCTEDICNEELDQAEHVALECMEPNEPMTPEDPLDPVDPGPPSTPPPPTPPDNTVNNGTPSDELSVQSRGCSGAGSPQSFAILLILLAYLRRHARRRI